MSVLYVRVPPTVKRAVEKAAAERGYSVNLYVQRLLEGAIRRQNQDELLRNISASIVPKQLTETCKTCGTTFRAHFIEHLDELLAKHLCTPPAALS